MDKRTRLLVTSMVVCGFFVGAVAQQAIKSSRVSPDVNLLKEQNLQLTSSVEQLLGQVEQLKKLAVASDANTPLGAFAAAGFNVIDSTSSTVTTTKAVNATLVLARNTSRIYAGIQNDSDTDVYIYLRNFTDQSAASTTVIRGQGIRLPANGGLFEILPENVITTDVWVASTTVAGKSIIATER